MHFLCWARPAAKYEHEGDDVILAGQQTVAKQSKPVVKSSKDTAQVKGNQQSSDVGHQLSKLQHTLAESGQHLRHASITSQGGGSKHLTITTGGDASPRSPNPPGFSHIPGRPSLASMSPTHQQNSGTFSSTVTSLQTTTSRQGPIQALAHSDVRTISASRSGQMAPDIDAMSDLSDPGEYEHYGGDSGDEVEAVAYEGAKVTPAGSVMGEEDRISCASPGCFQPRNSKLTLMSTVANSRRATADEPQGPPTAEPPVPQNPVYSMRRRSDSLHKTPQGTSDGRASGASSHNNSGSASFISTAAKRKSSSGGSRTSQSRKAKDGKQVSRSTSQSRQTPSRERISTGGETARRSPSGAAKPAAATGPPTMAIETPERSSNRSSSITAKERTSPQQAATVLTPDRVVQSVPDRASPQQPAMITIPDMDDRQSPAMPSKQSVESGNVLSDRPSPKLVSTPSHVSQSSSGRLRAALGSYREPTRSSVNRRSASFAPETGEAKPLASMNAAWSSSLRSSSTTPTQAGALRGRQPSSSQYAGRTLSPAVKPQDKKPQETERKQPATSPCVRRLATPTQATHMTTRTSLEITPVRQSTAAKAPAKSHTSGNAARTTPTADKLIKARTASPGPSSSTISYSVSRANSSARPGSAPSPSAAAANAKRGKVVAGKGKKEPEAPPPPPPGPIVPAITSVNSPLVGGELPVGAWRFVRLQKSAACDACNGTTLQETVDGSAEVFQCDQVLNAGALAVVICHTKAGCLEPKTWVFCPDPLCLGSKPTGSCFTKWPTKITLAPGTKITRSEYANLKELGLDVAAPQAPSQPPSQPVSMQQAVPLPTPQPTAA